MKNGRAIQRWFNSGDHGVTGVSTGVDGGSQQDESLHSIYSKVLSMKSEMKRKLNDELTAWCTEG